MKVKAFFHSDTSTLTYVAYDQEAGVGVVIDPVLDLDLRSGRIEARAATEVAHFIEEAGLRVPYVLETHVHADHLSAASWFKERFGCRTVIGSGVVHVQKLISELFAVELPGERMASGEAEKRSIPGGSRTSL